MSDSNMIACGCLTYNKGKGLAKIRIIYDLRKQLDIFVFYRLLYRHDLLFNPNRSLECKL